MINLFPVEQNTMEVFGCLWAECGFESPSSEEMVRHINFHSFHTKIKCHGYNMITGTHSVNVNTVITSLSPWYLPLID